MTSTSSRRSHQPNSVSEENVSKETQMDPKMPAAKQKSRPGSNAARERSRVKTLKMAFLDLQRTLPAVPRDTKLSKLDVLVLATTYIAHLTKALNARAPCVDCCGCCHSNEQEVVQGGFACLQANPPCKTSGLNPNECGQTSCAKSSRGTTEDLKNKLDNSGCKEGKACNSGCVLVESGRRLPSQSYGTVEAGQRRKSSVPRVRADGYLHPVKKWPMRTRLYAGIVESARDLTKYSCTSCRSRESNAARETRPPKSGAAKKWPL